MPSSTQRLPALFVSHGSPMVALQSDGWNRALEGFAASIPRPKAIVVASAHWEERGPVRVSSADPPPTIHDFGGFPDELYALRYPAPGSPALAREIADALAAAGTDVALDPERGLDHGAWVPLRFLYPDARVPVVAVSLPRPRTPAGMLAVGRALSPLRDQGVLLLGSGGIVHNLRLVDFEDKQATPQGWAVAFDSWIAERLERFDVDSIARYESAPEARRAVPTSEHFDPIFPVLGSAAPGERARTVFEGFHHGTLSMRSFAVGQ